MKDQITINGVRLDAEIDKEEACVRFFGAPFLTEGGQLLTVQEWYQLALGENARVRFQRERDKLRELCQLHRESNGDYVVRLDKLQDAHWDGCRDCNYDHECNQCNADDDGDAHNCNCHIGIGYGYQLRKTLELARAALKAEGK